MNPSTVIDLGLDRTRMKDPRDVARQHETVRVLLERFFHEDLDRRFELQVLADEVGMGKTFVALAVAFSILQAHRERHEELHGTYAKVLVLVPQNDALFVKWRREVGEFRRRCIREPAREEAARRFAAVEATRPDDLVAALTRLKGPQVVVAKTSSLGAQVRDHDAKAQLVLGVLFRTWGTSFRYGARRRLLKAASERWEWPEDPEELAALDPAVAARLPVDPERVQEALRKYVGRRAAAEAVQMLLERCRDAAEQHFVDARIEAFKRIRPALLDLYKTALFAELLRQDLPLVIVDEAHNWKNHRNNYPDFIERLAPQIRRLLLLTATPFQLRPDEMLEILTPSDSMKISDDRRDRLKHLREQEIRSVLEQSAAHSKRFSKEWARLGGHATTSAVDAAWARPSIRDAVVELRAIADRPGALRQGEIDLAVDRGLRGIDPRLRSFIREALQLYARNRDLSQELGALVLRHRRHTGHRLVRVGNELLEDAAVVVARPGAHALHASPGIDVRGEAELPHYLLMRASSEIKEGKGKAALGASLTGCYSTLFKSAESAKFSKVLQGPAGTYVRLLNVLVGDERADEAHPKMAAVVADVLDRWERGEKTLLFTFRTNTARRLRDLLEAGVAARLATRRRATFGGADGLDVLRQRLTSRDRDLIPLVLDRVLWSMHWAPPSGEPALDSALLSPAREDYVELGRLALRFDVDVLAERVDRVFLHRAAECAQARRIVGNAPPRSPTRRVLEAIADESWVARAYGLPRPADDDDATVLVSEKGVHAVYEPVIDPDASAVDRVCRGLVDRDGAARRSGRPQIIRAAFDGPNLWLGKDPRLEIISGCELPVDVEVDLRDQRLFHVHLSSLSWSNGELDWATRALAMQAVRRAALRESLLVRLLPSAAQLEDASWGELLVERFSSPLGGSGESLLRRLAVFLEDLAAADGDVSDPATARGGLYDATRTTKQSGVVLVDGSTNSEQRNRAFAGFNTPLVPEILICTAVGQEGIDLHRQCRSVIHYDLAWNPATLEQRTGRVDRIGCLALRERRLHEKLTTTDEPTNSATGSAMGGAAGWPADDEPGGATNGPMGSAAQPGVDGGARHLEVCVPYLAGTYDERMFEELRLRAQTFEVLTGGDLAPDHVEGQDDEGHDDEGDERAAGLVALPAAMVKELRVNLAVYGREE